MEAYAGFAVILWFFLIIVAVMSLFIPFWIYRIRNEVIEQTNIQRETLKSMNRIRNEVIEQTNIFKVENETQKKEEYIPGIEYCFNCIEYKQSSGKCQKTGFNIDKLYSKSNKYLNPCEYKYFRPISEQQPLPKT